MQYLAELIIENYCMSEIGITTYAQPQGADEGYREGKPDVSELFEQQELVASSISGLLPPLSDMKVKIEVSRMLPCFSNIISCSDRPPYCFVPVAYCCQI